MLEIIKELHRIETSIAQLHINLYSEERLDDEDNKHFEQIRARLYKLARQIREVEEMEETFNGLSQL